MKYLVALLATMILAGCSTTPITMESGTMVPEDRVYLRNLVPKMDDENATAQVIFLRDSGMAGSACTHDIFINSQKAFSIDSGEFATLRLNPGDYLLKLSSGGGACPDILISESVTLKAGDSVEYRILLPSDIALRMTRIK